MQQKKLHHLYKLLSVFFVSLFWMKTSLANTSSINAEATITYGKNLAGTGQILLPVYNDEHSIFFIDIDSYIDKNASWGNSLGIGFRQLLEKERLLGFNLFINYADLTQQQNVWSLTPGFEYYFSPQWSLHSNGYLPLSKKRWLEKTAFAADKGDYRYINFHNHQQYDHRFTYYRESGTGADTEIGWHSRKFPGLSLYGGSYFFNFPSSSAMQGLLARIEIPVQPHVKIMLSDSYDNYQRNQFTIGIKWLLDDNFKQPQHRLLSPVERHFTQFNRNTSLPVIQQTYDNGITYLARDNIWFFQPGGTPNTAYTDQSCTYEHPCTGLDQTAVNSIYNIAPNAAFYLNTGQYNQSTPLTLMPGQSIFGRTEFYKKPAHSNETVIIGSLNLTNHTTLDHIKLINDPTHPYSHAVTINNAEDVKLIHTTVGENNSQYGYPETVIINNSQGVEIDHSTILAYASAQGDAIADARAIETRSSNLHIRNSQVSAIAYADKQKANAVSIVNFSINPQQPGELTIQHSHILAYANSQQGSAISTAIEHLAFTKGGKISIIDNSIIDSTAAGINGIAYAKGISAYGHEESASTIDITQSILNINASSEHQTANATGISSSGELSSLTTFNLNNVMLNAKALNRYGNAETYAIYADPAFEATSVFNILNSEINTYALSITGNSYANIAKTEPIYAGKIKINLINSYLNMLANSQLGQAHIATLNISNTDVLLANNHIWGRAVSSTGKTSAVNIIDRGDNTIQQKGNIIDIH